MIEAALQKTGKSGTFESYEAVPEYSAAGASASNGRAERAVQTIGNQLRTLKSALEARIDTRVPSTHPVLRWLVEHAASLINRFKVHGDGQTSYQKLHGKRSSEKVVEVGEQVFFSVPRDGGPSFAAVGDLGLNWESLRPAKSTMSHSPVEM